MIELPSNGIDAWYVDESTDPDILAMSAIAIPFMRPVDEKWMLVVDDYFEQVRAWRRDLRAAHGIPVNKELKGTKLVAGRNRYLQGKHSLRPAAGVAAYRDALSRLGFLAPSSIITVVGAPSATLYGHGRLEAILFALLQRMRTACDRSKRAGMIFFDEGHGEYRKLYRKARIYLPTGSALGNWSDGKSAKNLPLANFVGDANIRQSEHCNFTQIADLLSFAALNLRRGEIGTLPDDSSALGIDQLYDAIPVDRLNLKASGNDPKRGIVRLG